MEISDAIRVCGLLRVAINDRAVRDRLRQRPDWRNSLYRQLVRLRDPFPSDVEIGVLTDAEPRADMAVPQIPRLGRIGISPLQVGSLQIDVRNGELTTIVGSEVTIVDPATLAGQGFGLISELPALPDQVAFVVWVAQGATAAEWREVTATRWAEIQLVQRAQRAARRGRDKPLLEKNIREARAELERRTGTGRDRLAEIVAELEDRLAKVSAEPEPIERVRIDLPCRELIWLREFLRTGKKPSDIAADWETQVEKWRAGRAKPDPLRHPLLAAAHDECLTKRRKSQGGVDRATVERGLKRWLGPHLRPPAKGGRTAKDR